MFYEFTTVKGEKFTLNMNCIEYFTETKKGTLIVCKSGMDYEVLHTYEEVKKALRLYFCFSEVENQ